MPDREKAEQEQRPLMKIEDNFKKIIITKDSPTMWYTEEGVLVMSIYDFMLNENSLDEWIEIVHTRGSVVLRQVIGFE